MTYNYEYVAVDKFSGALEKMAAAQDALNRSVRRGEKLAGESSDAYNKMAAAMDRVSQALARSAVNAAAFSDETQKSTKAAERLGDETQKMSRASRDHAASVERGYGFLKSSAGAALEIFKHLESAAGVKGFAEQLKSVESMSDKLIDLQNALNISDEKFAALAGPKGSKIFDAAAASGLSAAEVMTALKSTQAATSTGEELLANPAILRNQALFTKASGGKLGEMTTAAAIMGLQFRMTGAEKADLPGITYMQALQGSLEASSMPKFAKGAAPYIGATGKTGSAGYAEYMALNNIIKDKSGLLGEEGAATTATLSLALMDALNTKKKRDSIEKAMGGKVTDDKGRVSFGLMYERMRAAGVKLDPKQAAAAVGGDDVALDEVGDSSKFMKALANEVRDRSTRRALVALLVSAQTDYGTDKDLRRLSRVNASEGQAAIETAAGRWRSGSATTRRQIEEDEQTRRALGSYDKSMAVPMLESIHKDAGRFAADYPTLAKIEEIPILGWPIFLARQFPSGGPDGVANERAGAQAAMAFAQGAASQQPLLYEAGVNTAKGAHRGYATADEQRSPSKVMERLGAYSAKGLHRGYEREMPMRGGSGGGRRSVTMGDINVSVTGGGGDDLARQIATEVRLQMEEMLLEAGG